MLVSVLNHPTRQNLYRTEVCAVLYSVRLSWLDTGWLAYYITAKTTRTMTEYKHVQRASDTRCSLIVNKENNTIQHFRAHVASSQCAHTIKMPVWNITTAFCG